MTYWWLLLAITLAIIAAWIGLSRRARSRLERRAVRLALALVPALLAIFLLLVALSSADRFMSADSWFERSPAREIILFAVMGLGMVARMLSLAIEERSAKRAELGADQRPPPLRIDHWDILYPFLSSAVCFGVLAESVSAMAISLPVILLAFQNGFFWQTILGGIRAKA